MRAKEKNLGKSGLIIIGSIIVIMLIIGIIGYISGKISNPAGSSSNSLSSKNNVAPEENEFAPNFTLKTINNKSVSLSDYKGKVVFINFWATWCPACKIELPSIEKLSERFKNKPFVVIAVNVDESYPENVKKFAQRMNLTFPVLIDNGDVSKAYRINSIPTTFIINKNGKIAAIVAGARSWDKQSYIDAFDKLIAEPYKK